MSKNLILIVGNIGAGKSTAATYLNKSYGFQELMFAEPLKLCAIALGFDRKDVYGSQEDKLKVHPVYGITAREFLQKFGTDLCRDKLKEILPTMCDPTLWITCMKNNLTKYENAVISDGRFLDEAKFVKDNGGVILRINRDNLQRETVEHKHISEIEQSQIKADYEIENTGDLNNLRRELDKFMNLYFRKVNKIEWYDRYRIYAAINCAKCGHEQTGTLLTLKDLMISATVSVGLYLLYNTYFK